MSTVWVLYDMDTDNPLKTVLDVYSDEATAMAAMYELWATTPDRIYLASRELLGPGAIGAQSNPEPSDASATSGDRT